MTRHSVFIVMIGVIFCAAIFAATHEYVGTLERFTGSGAKIETQDPEHRGTTRVSRGQKLFFPFVLRTGDSRSHFRLRDGTYCEAGEKTSVTLEKASLVAPKEVVLRFNYGALRVTSPYASVSQSVAVKSTNVFIYMNEPSDFFMVQAAGSRDLQIAVVYGKITLQNIITNERVEAIQGMNLFVRVSGAIESVGEVDAKMLQSLKGRTHT